MTESAPKARLFLIRNNGDMIPLIVADELPRHIIVKDVPRVMSAFDISPGMHCVANLTFRHRQHTIRISNKNTAGRNNDQSSDSPLKAQFFITRENGAMVPAIVMDELPEHVVVESVPRVLSVSDIIGMTCIGTHASRDKEHMVENVNDVPLDILTKRSLGVTANKLGDTSNGTATPKLSPKRPVDSTPLEFGDSAMMPSPVLPVTPSHPADHNNTTSGATTESETISSTIRPEQTEHHELPTAPAPKEDLKLASLKQGFLPGVKEYCSYWIRHGECDYAQQGCLYKHEMPLDPQELGRLGLRDIPKWFREKHQLGSYLATGGSGAAFSGVSLKSAAANGVRPELNQTGAVRSWHSGQWREPSRPFRGGRNRNFYPRPPFHQNRRQAPLAHREDKPKDTLHSRQQAETIKALDEIERAEKARKERVSASQLLKSKWNINVSKTPAATDTEEGDASGSSSETNTAATPASSPPTPRRFGSNIATPVRILQRSGRRPSMTSMVSDIEGEIFRADTARRIKENEEYRKVCEQHKHKAAIENFKASLEKSVDKVAGQETASSAGKGSGRRGGRKGRGRKNGGTKNSTTKNRDGATSADE